MMETLTSAVARTESQMPSTVRTFVSMVKAMGKREKHLLKSNLLIALNCVILAKEATPAL